MKVSYKVLFVAILATAGTNAFAADVTGLATTNYVKGALTTELAKKQDSLVSGTNIKTINNTSVLGSGNIAVQPTVTGAATTITSSNLTASRAVISNGSGKVAVSDTTDTELGYVHGVTSAIQTQLNGKQPTLTTGESGNIKGDGSVTVTKNATTGVITIYGTDTQYTLPNATTSTKGGVIVGSNIGVTNGTISVADGTTGAKGVVKLTNTIDSSNSTLAVTGKAVADAGYQTVANFQAQAPAAGTTLTDVQKAARYPSVAYTEALITGMGNSINASLGDLATEDTINTDFIDNGAVTAPKLADQVIVNGTNTTVSRDNSSKKYSVNVATGTPTAAGVVKVGQIPSGSATSTTYATIWVQ